MKKELLLIILVILIFMNRPKTTIVPDKDERKIQDPESTSSDVPLVP